MKNFVKILISFISIEPPSEMGSGLPRFFFSAVLADATTTFEPIISVRFNYLTINSSLARSQEATLTQT